MKTRPPHITQKIGVSLIVLFLIGATLVKVMPLRDYVAELERKVDAMECKR